MPRSKPKKKLTVPADLRAALKKNKRASATFDGFSYTNKKEYIEWITEAKRPETRASAWPRPSSGWPQARSETGNTSELSHHVAAPGGSCLCAVCSWRGASMRGGNSGAS